MRRIEVMRLCRRRCFGDVDRLCVCDFGSLMMIYFNTVRSLRATLSGRVFKSVDGNVGGSFAFVYLYAFGQLTKLGVI